MRIDILRKEIFNRLAEEESAKEMESHARQAVNKERLTS